MIPYGRQHISEQDIDAVVDVLRSDWLTQGPAVPRFEQALAEYCDIPFAIAFNSATSALHAACLALDIDAASRVWVPAISFVASANCAEYCGAAVEFVDVEPDSGNLCMRDLRQRLELAESKGLLPDLVVCVHYAGQYCDMQTLGKLAQHFGFSILEDASHALGAEVPQHWTPRERGVVRVYSFHPVKMITSAEGGMALTSDPNLAMRLRSFGNHGIERDAERWQQESPGSWYYEQQLLGFNYRMSELHAALGNSQLQQLPDFLRRRRQLAQRYREQLQSCDQVEVLNQQKYGVSSYHLFPVLLPEVACAAAFERLRTCGIGVQKHYIPIPAQPYYRNRYGDQMEQFPAAQRFYQRVVSLPMFTDLNATQQDAVVEQLRLCQSQE